VFPALVTVGYTWLFDGCRWLWGRRTATLVAGAFASAWFLLGWFVPVDFLRGPKAAAETIVRGSPARVLYAGQADGNFIFAVRELDPKLQVVVVSVTKLSRANFEPGALQAFCRKYGIEWVVFEDLPGQPYWSGVRDHLRTWAKLGRTIPLESTPASRWHQGTIQIYRLPPAPDPPGGVLQLPVPNLGGYISVKL
jgi:hypothetical protein